MKYIKTFEDNNLESDYHKFDSELQLYIDYFKSGKNKNNRGWDANEASLKTELKNFKKNARKNVGMLLRNNNYKILVSVGENKRVLVHIWNPNLSVEEANKDRRKNKFAIINDIELLHLFMESKIKGFNPILRVDESDGKYLSEGKSKTNILNNIFDKDISGIIDKTGFYMCFANMVTYFIFFSDENTILKWWNYVRNISEAIQGICNTIENSPPDIYDKFKSIVKDDISNSSDMFNRGFSD